MAGLLVCAVVSVLVLSSLFPALRFTPTAAVSSAPPTTEAVRPVASFTPAPGAPATRVVSQLLDGDVPGLPAGMRAASPVTGTVAPAIALTCDEPVGPVVSRQRGWAAASGPLGTGVTVTASAYSAGAGAAAMKAMRTARSECVKGTSVDTADGVGVEALRATRTVAGVSVSSVLFRRGDVVVSVTGAHLDPPFPLLAGLDARLDRLLSAPGVCVDQRADVAAFARSLVSGPSTYTGFQQPTPVALPTTATPPPLVVPSATVSLPPPVTATTPAPPYWPDSAPTPKASPTPPAVPAPYPTATTVLQPRADTSGPGCGWAFTGMKAPVFDAAAAARTTASRASAAAAAMQAVVAAYPALAATYTQAWAQYSQAATEYAQTNQRIAEVEQAWALIRRQQADYAAALQQYQAQLADYTSFAQRQQAAILAYQQAVAACASAVPTPGPVPAPTTSQTPPAPTSTAPTSAAPSSTSAAPTTPAPSGQPGSLPAPQAPGGAVVPGGAPAPLAAAPQNCPPVPDPIITAMPPASPVSPAPPPDPRPTPLPNGATP